MTTNYAFIYHRRMCWEEKRESPSRSADRYKKKQRGKEQTQEGEGSDAPCEDLVKEEVHWPPPSRDSLHHLHWDCCIVRITFS